MKKDQVIAPSDSKMPIGWIEQPTSPLRVARSTTELNGLATTLEGIY